MLAIALGLVAALLGFIQWRNEQTITAGVEAAAEIVRIAQRSTQTDRTGASARDRYFIDIVWQVSATERRHETDIQISDGYARRLNLAGRAGSAPALVRIAYRPRDPGVRPLLLDDRGLLGWLSGGQLAGLASGLLLPGAVALWSLRRLRLRDAKHRAKGSA